ncbi:hypothetical protein [aff. Roholtiella sp. LEGE 12411]|uniref:hypothetical protein n=1 Tax=aff. Roholtiella sp. LEGE 12411 TaxID=1828822 RepID=UPI00187E18EE|nr:hypothetical protein [aff. Roholtiella sp. LEGE 12411]MBE9035418.1 hypothetical protein [aff. Roholtiella sp. LEGE 12411]
MAKSGRKRPVVCDVAFGGDLLPKFYQERFQDIACIFTMSFQSDRDSVNNI